MLGGGARSFYDPSARGGRAEADIADIALHDKEQTREGGTRNENELERERERCTIQSRIRMNIEINEYITQTITRENVRQRKEERIQIS